MGLRRGVPAGVLVAVLGAANPVGAVAQEGFFFDAPRWQVVLKGGLLLPSAQGDVFEFVTSELTLDPSDFRALAFEGELVLFPTDRVGVALGLGRSSVSPRSEFRDWVGSDGEPIAQMTRLQLTSLNLTLRYYLLPRGREVSRLAWLPASTLPYIGAGGGVTWYRMTQSGEFVDFVDQSIFHARLDTHGGTLTRQLLAGLEHWFTSRAGILVEGHYAWGRAPTSDGGFSQMESIDIGGFSSSLGLTLRR